jgi:acyl-CoA synthetase (AMP-forming)/AMP-acid ligase II
MLQPAHTDSSGTHVAGINHSTSKTYSRHPTSQTTQIRILGRTDDLIVLATGEKVLLTTLEKTAAEHPAVKDVLAFGNARASLGMLVEISEAFENEYSFADGERKFLKSFELYIERGNTVTDSHGKIFMDMIVITHSSSKPLLRTAENTLARKANYAVFEEEIKQCYDRAELVRVDPQKLLGILRLNGYASRFCCQQALRRKGRRFEDAIATHVVGAYRPVDGPRTIWNLE